MNQFNVHKWKNNQLLKEAGLLNENQVSQVAKAIDGAISSIDDSLSYKVLASAVAQILKDEYGSHNFVSFMETLKDELGMEESLNEEKGDLMMNLTQNLMFVLLLVQIKQKFLNEMTLMKIHLKK